MILIRQPERKVLRRTLALVSVPENIFSIAARPKRRAENHAAIHMSLQDSPKQDSLLYPPQTG